jgi:hypothetical protein
MIERRRPPAWDPPILLLVVSQLVVVTTLGVVVANISVGSCIRGSVIWLHQTDMGEKESKATVSTHPKYSASKDLHYICNIIKGRLYMWTRLQKCQNREKS